MTIPRMTSTPRLPAGAKAILPTIWLAFIITVLLALAFTFGNVWDLARSLHVERHVAPLIGPTVDITAIGLLVVVPWLVLAGVREDDLRAARRLMMLAGFLTLALNSAPSAIHGWTGRDATAWGRAVVEAIVPTLLIAWSHVGPKLIGKFMEARDRIQAKITEVTRAAEQASAEDLLRHRAEVDAAVQEALRRAAAERDAALAEDRALRAAQVKEFLQERAQRQAELDAAFSKSAQLEDEVSRLRERMRAGSKTTTRRGSTGRSASSAETAPKAPRKSAAELLEERVEAAKEALPTWQLETPSGPEIASALGLKSDGIVSEIRKRLEADRLAATNQTGN